jgi:hypothetical protein
MLDDNGRISHQRPKVVRADSRVALEMVKEGLGVGIVVRV